MTNVPAADRAAIRRHRWRLVVPVTIALLLLGGYTVLWFQGARVMRSEIAEWVADQRASGLDVQHGAIRIRGYPGTLRAEIEDPAISRPDDWSWNAETLFVITEPLNPRRLLLTPRGPQDATYEGTAYEVLADDLRVSLEEGQVLIETAGLRADAADRSMALEAGRINLVENDDESRVLSFALGQVAYADGDQAYVLPRLNAALSAEAGAGLGLDAFEGAVSSSADQPASPLAGQGRVTINEEGYPDGQLSLTVSDREALARTLLDNGVIDRNRASMLIMLLGSFADESGTTTVPLGFVDGMLQLGPVAVVELPRL